MSLVITDRTRPFWQATYDLLIDGNWHHRDELHALGRTHGLAERTISNFLPRAAKRRWIERRDGLTQVRLRDRRALVQALAASTNPGGTE